MNRYTPPALCIDAAHTHTHTLMRRNKKKKSNANKPQSFVPETLNFNYRIYGLPIVNVRIMIDLDFRCYDYFGFRKKKNPRYVHIH